MDDKRHDLETLAAALTPRERAFADAFLGEARRNKTRAAEIAGYKADRRHSLTEMACRLATKINVAAYINAMMDAHSMEQAEVLTELSEIARIDLSEFLIVDGNELRLDLVKMREKGCLHWIAGIEFDKHGNQVIKFRDKQAALQALMRVRRMGGENLTIDGGIMIREYPEGA